MLSDLKADLFEDLMKAKVFEHLPHQLEKKIKDGDLKDILDIMKLITPKHIAVEDTTDYKGKLKYLKELLDE